MGNLLPLELYRTQKILCVQKSRGGGHLFWNKLYKIYTGFFFRHSLFDLKKFEETQKHEHFYFKWEFLSQRIQYFNIGRGWHQGVNLEIINSVNYVATQFGKLQAITYKKISHVSFGFINFSFSMLNNVVMVLFFRFLKYWSHFQGRPKKLNQMKN